MNTSKSLTKMLIALATNMMLATPLLAKDNGLWRGGRDRVHDHDNDIADNVSENETV